MDYTPTHAISELSEILIDSLSLNGHSAPKWEAFLKCILDGMHLQGGRLILNEGQNSVTLSEFPSDAMELLSEHYQLDDAELILELYIDPRLDKQPILQVLEWVHGPLAEVLNLAYRLQKMNSKQKISLCCEETLGIARYTLNQRGEIIETNQAGDQLMLTGVVNMFRKRIQLKPAENWLKSGIDALVRKQEEALYQTVHSEKSVFHCVLIALREHSEVWLKSAAKFLLLIIPSSQKPRSEQLRQMFGLNDAEAAIASWFSAGLSAEDVASKTGYTTHTVYSYIKKLYSQLGINKQSQLTAMVWRSMPVSL